MQKGHIAMRPTDVPGKGWNTLMRLFGLIEPWFDKTWRQGEIELAKKYLALFIAVQFANNYKAICLSKNRPFFLYSTPLR